MTPKISITQLTFAYGKTVVLDNLSATFDEHRITAITGPSGRGKSTFLTVLNRLWEDIAGARITGSVQIRFGNNDLDIYHPSVDVCDLRRRVGMVFQTPNPLPMSIMKNVTFPLTLAGEKGRENVHEKAKTALQAAFLWDEVKDRLGADARSLSGGQQQRLCIARALVLTPEVLLLDEPTSSLDRNAGEVIEDLLIRLKDRCTVLMVSHYQDQVQRVADRILEL
ncbi:MAG: phosphate ABC transporter ATP-binding protein [Thermodesulfobacteriota bacterium]|nr:phosphate ABC transporter ATP-binding protein [Thermodesulfobacteriota bacterium]